MTRLYKLSFYSQTHIAGAFLLPLWLSCVLDHAPFKFFCREEIRAAQVFFTVEFIAGVQTMGLAVFFITGTHMFGYPSGQIVATRTTAIVTARRDQKAFDCFAPLLERVDESWRIHYWYCMILYCIEAMFSQSRRVSKVFHNFWFDNCLKVAFPASLLANWHNIRFYNLQDLIGVAPGWQVLAFLQCTQGIVANSSAFACFAPLKCWLSWVLLP